MPNRTRLSSDELYHGGLSTTFKVPIVDTGTPAKPIGCKKTCASEAPGINDYR